MGVGEDLRIKLDYVLHIKEKAGHVLRIGISMALSESMGPGVRISL